MASKTLRSTFVLALLLGVVMAGQVAANVPESEPNDTPATADELPTGPEGDWGGPAHIEAGSFDEDWWKVTNVGVGHLLFAYINDDTPLNEGQPWLVAYANDGVTEVEPSAERIAGAVVPQAGNVYLRVSEQGNNQDLDYAVLQYVGPMYDSEPEAEPNNTRAQAMPITTSVITGTVSGSDVDHFSFTIDDPARTWVTVIVDNDPDDDGNYTQTVLDLVDNTGASIAFRADDYVAKSNIAEFFTVPYLGTFYFQIGTDVWSEDTDYRFVLLINGASLGSDELFADGFESGNTSRWSNTVP